MTRRNKAVLEQDAQPQEQLAEQPEIQQSDQPTIQESGDAKPRRRRQAEKAQPVELDPAFIHDSSRMQYALLLALLLRQRGTTKFNAKDMSYDETDYNILFARTLDGQHLEVTVVSAESGIIRSPERQKEMESWTANGKLSKEEDAKTSTYQPLPESSLSGDNPSLLFALHGLQNPNLLPSNPSPTPALPPSPQEIAAKLAADQQQQRQPAGLAGDHVLKFPAGDPRTTPTDGTSAYHFPFQVGNRPEDVPENLDLMHQRLLQRDQAIQAEEAAAIQRMEEEGKA